MNFSNHNSLSERKLFSLNKIKNDNVEIYNYSNSGSCSWFDFAKQIAIYFNKDELIIPINPTTNNVVGINDIVEEDPLVSSVICENNNLEALPISNKYSSFVKRLIDLN